MNSVTIATITTIAGIVVCPLTASLKENISRRIGFHSNNIVAEIAKKLDTDEDSLRKYLNDSIVQSQIQNFKDRKFTDVDDSLLYKKFCQHVKNVSFTEFKKQWTVMESEFLTKLSRSERDAIIFERSKILEDVSKIHATIFDDHRDIIDKLEKLTSESSDLWSAKFALLTYFMMQHRIILENKKLQSISALKLN